MEAAHTMNRVNVSVVAFQEGDLWVAQCVEYDIAAHASDLTRLPAAFERALLENLCINAELGREGLDGIPAAPEFYRELFDGGMDLKPRSVAKPRALARTPKPRVQIGRLRVA